MEPLTGAQRKHLRGLAHAIKPVVRVGRSGLTDAVIGQLDDALADHELVKIKLTGDKREKQETTAHLAAGLGCHRVGLIGHTAIFYRPAEEPEHRRIRLPG